MPGKGNVLANVVELGFGFVIAVVTTSSIKFLDCYLVLRVKAGLLEGFPLSVSCCMLSVDPCVQLRLGGVALRILAPLLVEDCCCLLLSAC